MKISAIRVTPSWSLFVLETPRVLPCSLFISFFAPSPAFSWPSLPNPTHHASRTFLSLDPWSVVRARSLEKGLALPAHTRHIKRMSSTVLEAKKLRPDIIQRIENMDDENLLVLHRFLLIVEKERLWRELSAEAEQDRASGQLDRLPEIIRGARAALREG